jgi:hypothetical protein
MVPSRYITGKMNQNKYPQFIMGVLTQVKNGEEQFWKLCHILKNRMPIAICNLFYKLSHEQQKKKLKICSMRCSLITIEKSAQVFTIWKTPTTTTIKN